MGAGQVGIKYLVEVTFTNSHGATYEVDRALESMNGRDWRMACDAICGRILTLNGANPYEFDWPTPDARVTYDWAEDEDDVMKTVTLVWTVDERTWRWMNRAAATAATVGTPGGAEKRDGKART